MVPRPRILAANPPPPPSTQVAMGDQPPMPPLQTNAATITEPTAKVITEPAATAITEPSTATITEPVATITEPTVISAEEEFELQLSKDILDFLLLSPADWIRMEFEIRGGNQRLWTKYLREKDTLLMERPDIKSGSGREAITWKVRGDVKKHTDKEIVEFNKQIGIRGFDFEKKNECTDGKNPRINCLDLLIKLWSGDWKENLKKLNESVDDANSNRAARAQKIHGDEPLYRYPHPCTFRSLTQQLELGWFALLCRYITSDLSQAQHNYFRYTQRKRHGNTWAKQLSIKLWSITFNIWKHRNNVLHDTDAVHQLSGMEILKQSITAEYKLGQVELPMPYSPFFYQPLPLLLRKSHTYLKQWFMMIRAGRESYYENQPITNKFITDTTLRVWIGLSQLE